MSYTTPVDDIAAALDHAGFQELLQTRRYREVSTDLIETLLSEAGRFAEGVIAPLQRIGDLEGARMADGRVLSPPGFRDAYAAYVESGWGGLSFPGEWGGQDLPHCVSLAVYEIFCGACLAFSGGASLTLAAAKALIAHGDETQQRLFLPKLVSGAWTGSICLSEPQAGSDLALIKTRAEPAGDGQYKIRGQKIWITLGDHDMAENICYLALARLPDGPPGVKGLSMFLVPRVRVNADASLGAVNDVRAVGIEKKLGQHAQPTCVMSFGDHDECLATLIGRPHEGIRNMFTMMNAARIDAGVQAVGIGEAAFQKALAYAAERRQGRPFGVKSGAPRPIAGHPDVQRNLLTMKALTAASRAISYAAMIAHDLARHGDDSARRERARRREALLTPIAKAFSSERGVETAQLGIQIHGGVGYVEETGAAQYLRDVRVTTIYEGATGIHGVDLVGRKLSLDDGLAFAEFRQDIDAAADRLDAAGDKTAGAIAAALREHAAAFDAHAAQLRARLSTAAEDALFGATPFLEAFGYLAGAFYLARAAAADLAGDAETRGGADSLMLARFYADHILPRASAHLASVGRSVETHALRSALPAVL